MEIFTYLAMSFFMVFVVLFEENEKAREVIQLIAFCLMLICLIIRVTIGLTLATA